LLLECSGQSGFSVPVCFSSAAKIVTLILMKTKPLIPAILLLIPLTLMAQKPFIGVDSLAFIQTSIKKINKNVNFTIIPGPTANATQKLGFGVLPMIVYNLDKKDSLSPPSSTAILIYFDFYGSWATAAQQNFYWNQNKWRAIIFTGYGQLKIKFFGIGSNTKIVSNDDSNWVWGNENSLIFSLTCYRKIFSHLYGGLEYNYTSLFMEGKDSAAAEEMKQSGVIMGTTIESKITPTFVWDSRDNIYWSLKGIYSGLSLQFSSKFLASSNNFYVMSGFVNGYHKLSGNNDRLSLAWRLFIQGESGEVPYDQLSNYCHADKVMGYTTGKYVNYGEANAQVEVRYDIWKLLGAGGFVSLGKVFGAVNNFGQTVWLPSAGINCYINLIPYRKMRMRLSGALGLKDWGLYVGVGQMF
jgi:hypothetical protein